MAYDQGLAERVRELLASRPDLVEKKMFGGLAFMLSGHMCVGILKDRLMARV
ncbi:MAG: TfoX/Sxy family protein, partial [Gammaproteobacteria bacterium]